MVTSLLFFQGCNSKYADLSPIKNAPFTLTVRNLTSVSNVIIYMTNSDGSESFAKFFTTTPTISMEVPKGTYDFYGISYNGTTVSQCAIQKNQAIRNIENPVILDFDASTCSNEIYNFANTDIEFCETVRGVTSLNGRCTDDMTEMNREGARGHVLSFRWSVQGFSKEGGNLRFTGDEFWSDCTDTLPTTMRSLSANPMNAILPAGDGSSTPFFIRLELWPAGAGCGSGEPVYVNLPRGLKNNDAKAKFFNDGASQKLYVQIDGNDICKGSNLTGEFAGGTGSQVTPKLICSEEQFYHIFPVLVPPNAALYTSYANFHYKLLADIDLSDNPVTGSGFAPPWEYCVSPGSNFMPIGSTWDGTFCTDGVATGSFDGGGKKIKGLKIISALPHVGFYGLSNSMRIQRVIFEDPVIDGIGNTGVVAGWTSGGYFRKIHILNPTVNSNGGNYVGSFSGQDEGSQFRDILITSAEVSGGNFTGGLAGAITMGDSGPIINRIFVDGTVTGNQNVGGVAGTFGTAGFLSIATQTRFVGNINASSTLIGGIFGDAKSATIANSYALSIFTSTLAAPTINLGGIVGYMSHQLGPPDTSGIFTSYASGSLTNNCTAFDACAMGNIIGNHDGTYSQADFLTAVYPNSIHLNTVTTFNGSLQPDASFLSSNPGWTSGGVDLMQYFDLEVWEFTDGKFPKLVQEPTGD